tara:strand:- start:383 stop:670 length:288 start_codon:yes stop_codon:yes gene_type:complete
MSINKELTDLTERAEDLFEREDLERGDHYYGWDRVSGYVGRGMVAPDGRQTASPLAYTLYSRYQGPESDVGKALAGLGFWSDNLGVGWIYYLRGA